MVLTTVAVSRCPCVHREVVSVSLDPSVLRAGDRKTQTDDAPERQVGAVCGSSPSTVINAVRAGAGR
jgi:hypothetical protein